MELSARDIEQKQFHDAWRGYDQKEVDDFLDKVIEVVDRVQRENQALRKRVLDLEGAVAASRNTEQMLKTTLLTAQQAAEEAIAKAKAKAEQLVSEAEERARAASEEAKERAAAVESDARRKGSEIEARHAERTRELDASLERLRAMEAELKHRLKTFLEQQMQALNVLSDPADPRVRGTRRHPSQASSERPAPERPAAETPAPAHPPARADTDPISLVDGDPQRRTVRTFFGRAD